MPFAAKSDTAAIAWRAAVVRTAGRIAPMALLAMFGVTSRAAADDRCTGTLCDLYYTVRPAQQPAPAQREAAQPAEATPVTVPSSGGILDFFKGRPSDAPAAPGAAPAKPFVYLTDGTHYDHCTGTLCDAYYGITSSNKPAQQASVQPQQTTTEAPGGAVATLPRAAPTAEQVAVAKATQQRRAAQEAREQANAKCRLAGAGDPWHCFR